MPFSTHALVRAALCALAVAGTVRPASGEQLPLRLYTTSDGLVSDRIQCILSDSHGFLWIGTEDGISRFDGVEFTNLTETDLPGADVRGIVEGRDGTLWAATDRGLAHWNPADPSATRVGRPDVVHLRPGGAADEIRAVLEDHSGILWVGTADALYRMTPRGFGSWSIERVDFDREAEGPMLINVLLEDREERLWVGAENGLFEQRAPLAFARLGPEGGSPSLVRSLLETRDGTLWVGENGGLLALGPAVASGRRLVRRLERGSGLAGDRVAALEESSDGEVWVGCYGGLSELAGEGASPRTYTSAQGLAGTLVTDVAEDRDGNLWIGTDGAGLVKLARTGLRRFDASDGMHSTRVASLFEDRDGQPCAFTRGTRPEQIAADEAFIECFDGRRFRSSPIRPDPGVDFGWGRSQFVQQDREGHWWVPTAGGLYEFPPVRLESLGRTAPLRVYTARDGLPSSFIYRLFQDRRGDLWIGVLGGARPVARWDRSARAIRPTGPDPPTPGEPMAFAQDADGAVWIGFSSGALERHRGDATEVFGERHGLPSGRIQALHVDRRGRLWIATSRGGVVRVDRPVAPRPEFRRVAAELASVNVLTLAEDLQGRIYAGTERGLDRLDPDTGAVRHFTTEDGLAPGVVEAVLEDRDGSVWFGSVQGLSRLQPAAERPVKPAPARITSVRAHGEPRPVASMGAAEIALADLGAEAMPLEIGFAAVDFTPRGQERFQFRMEGVDPDWRTTEQRSVVYGRLPSGNYSFRVRRVAGAFAAGPPAEVRFRVLPPAWKRPEALAAAVLALGALLYAWHRSRVRAALAVERVRTGVASDLHDDIGAGLSEIAILSELVQRPEGRVESARLLREIGDGARRLVDSMSDIVWSTDPARDDAGSLILRIRHFAANALESQGIESTLETTPGLERLALDRDVRRQIFLIVKEALTNVARHAHCRHVRLRVVEGARDLWIEIEDDGRGLPPLNGSPMGRGLTSMRARATALRGELRVESVAAGGTRVVLGIPLNRGLRRRPA